MSATSAPPVQLWTTDEVPATQRFDYFVSALSSAIVPMHVQSDAPKAFSATMSAVGMGGISLVHQVGTAHRSFRSDRDESRNGEHTFHLILNLTSAWTISHCGAISLQPGDAVLTDSRYGHDLHLSSSFEIVHLKLSDAWLSRWVTNPDNIVGRLLPSGSPWAGPLTSFVSCLSPSMVGGCALSADALADQVGTLLSVIDAQIGGRQHPTVDAALGNRIRDCIAQRCAERELTAEMVAAALDIPVDVLNRELLACGTTFGQALLERRKHVASRMLSSPFFDDLSLGGISARAGFKSSSAMLVALQGAVLPSEGVGHRRGIERVAR